MASAIGQYFEAASDRIGREDGRGLAVLLTLDKSSIPGGSILLAALGPDPKANDIVLHLRRLSPEWQAVLVPHLQACALASSGRHLDAFSRSLESANALNEIVQGSGQWIIRPMLKLATDLDSECTVSRGLALASGRGEQHAELSKALIAALRGLWSSCYNHKGVPKDSMVQLSRKMGVYGLTNLLFRLWFRLDLHKEASRLVSSFEPRNGVETMPPLSAFPLSQTVPFKFYTGRLALYEEKYQEANAHLSFAFANCHRGYTGNARRILESLLPVKLRLGMAPPAGLLEQYGLAEAWGGIVAGVTCGDLRSYRSSLRTHAEYFIRVGVYVLLEGLHLLVLRTALKKVARILGTAQLRLPILSAAFSSPAITGEQGAAGGVIDPVFSNAMDVEELECLAAVLIARKFIRGYVSHAPPVLVLAKEKAFQRIKDTG